MLMRYVATSQNINRNPFYLSPAAPRAKGAPTRPSLASKETGTAAAAEEEEAGGAVAERAAAPVPGTTVLTSGVP